MKIEKREHEKVAHSLSLSSFLSRIDVECQLDDIYCRFLLYFRYFRQSLLSKALIGLRPFELKTFGLMLYGRQELNRSFFTHWKGCCGGSMVVECSPTDAEVDLIWR